VLLGAGDDVEVAAVGVTSDDGRPMRVDAIMRIQSMTKVITSVAALRLVESGRLGLDRGVEEWLPELAGRRVEHGRRARQRSGQSVITWPRTSLPRSK
jgi:CubicO group peptidase (beta-lactamase class C family)